MSQAQLKELLDSVHIPEDEELDAVAILGQWYIKTQAGNLDTARSERKKFLKFNDVIIENDYIQCEGCCESIVWGDDAVHYSDSFYHKICWGNYCLEYNPEWNKERIVADFKLKDGYADLLKRCLPVEMNIDVLCKILLEKWINAKKIENKIQNTKDISSISGDESRGLDKQ